MKKIFVILTLLCYGVILAQPQKINFQAVAVNASGVTVKNRVISLKLSILDSSSTGSVLYSETHQPTTDGSGQFSVYLGGGTAVLGTFSNIPWGNTKDKFLKAEADLNGGANYVLMGVSQVVSVPYALQAGSLVDSSKVIAQDGIQWSLIVGPNGPEWQQSSGPGGLRMNFPCPGIPSVTYGGQTYKTVQIGNQCWFQENLNIGTMILGANDQTNNSILEKYCYNNLPANCDTFGGLYQWAEAVQYQNGASNTASPSPVFSGNIKGICPTGWHLPSDADYCSLTTFLDASANCSIGTNSYTAGGMLKSTSGIWASPNTGATNNSGFSALPVGCRDIGTFVYIGIGTTFWSSSESSSASNALSGSAAICRSLYNDQSYVDRYDASKEYGFPGRCLKD
jgi:uncharacterized protein (TIGR02145 family)